MHWQRPKQWQHIGKQFQIACVSWESRATRIPLSPPALPCPFCQTVTHFTISFNALENRIRAQARAGISHPKKWVCVCLSVLCPAKPSSVFHSKVCRCARFDTFSVALSLSQNTGLPSLPLLLLLLLLLLLSAGMPIHLSPTSGSCKYARVRCREFKHNKQLKWATGLEGAQWRRIFSVQCTVGKACQQVVALEVVLWEVVEV